MEITPLIVFWEGNLWGNNTLLFGEVSLKVRFGAKTCNILRINSWEKNQNWKGEDKTSIFLWVNPGNFGHQGAFFYVV